MSKEKTLEGLALMEAMVANEFRLGAKVMAKEVVAGKEKTDKAGVVLVDPITHQTILWDDKYRVELAFIGGAQSFDLSQKEYDSLTVGKSYLIDGVISEVKSFGSSYIGIRPNQFTLLD